MKTATKLLACALALTLACCLGACGENEQGNSKAPINFSVGLTPDGRYDGIVIPDVVTLGQYTGIPYPDELFEVSDGDMQEEIGRITDSYAETKKVTDRAVADRDTVNIDYVGSVDGVEFEGGSTGGRGTDVTIGKTRYIGDFLEQLIGRRPGETFDIHVTFPEDYHAKELAGKPAVFSCTVHHIVEKIPVELTDEFVRVRLKDLGYASVEDMKAKIRGELVKTRTDEHLWKTLDENITCGEIPGRLIENEMTIQVKQVKFQAIQYGMDFEQVLQKQFGVRNEEEFREQIRPGAEARVKSGLMVQAVAEDAGLFATGEDIEEYFGRPGTDLTYEEAVAQYGKGYVARSVTAGKVMKYLADQNPVPER